MNRRVRVVAALIERGHGAPREGLHEALVTRRHDKGERAGLWEFPGGKVEAGEEERAALVRELTEELGVTVRVGDLFGTVSHDYPDVHVDLILYRATLDEHADPRPLEAAEMRWVEVSRLVDLPFCEADLPLLWRLASGAC